MEDVNPVVDDSDESTVAALSEPLGRLVYFKSTDVRNG